MQTVNFRCGHCNNLMAVGTEFLGQQVRCPHCQNVVVTPTSTGTPAPAAPEPTSPVPPEERPFRGLAESEDIFSQNAQHTDSLFDEPEASRLEVPPPAPVISDPLPTPPPEVVPPISLEPTLPQQPGPVAFQDAFNATISHSPGMAPLQPVESVPASDTVDHNAPTWMAPPSENGQAVAAGPTESAEPSAPVTRRPRDPNAGKVNWFIPLVFMPLLLYALLATAAVAYLYVLRVTAPPSLFDRMPDVEGDTPGVRPAGPKAGLLQFNKKLATQPLPKHLRVALGSTLTVGDLEVTPTRLERKHVGLFSEVRPDKSEPGEVESLVLHLKLKNLAKDYAFTPLDNYFDRHWSPKSDKVPLTMLEAGSTIFFGGPAPWVSLQDKNRETRREWIDGEGRKNIDREGLAPGATMNTIVCTNGWDPAISAFLFGTNKKGARTGKPYSGNLLWRVQLRRGLVPWKGKQVPATAVIGVEFTDQDIPSTATKPDENDA